MINTRIREAYERIDPSPAAAERIWSRIGGGEGAEELYSPERQEPYSPERQEPEWDQGAGESQWAEDREERADQGQATAYPERRTQSRSARHAKTSSLGDLFGRLPLPVVIAAAAVILVLIIVLIISAVGGKGKGKDQPTTPSYATPAGAASEDLSQALAYEGPEWALGKIANIESAMKEWNEYKSAKQAAYFAEKLPSLGTFLTEASAYDGTEVEANADDTYTLFHWRYMENWANTSVSPITGAAIPELTQVMDTENTVTVDANEYANYLSYIDETYTTYGDYNYIYSVYDQAEAAKLEEIAAKYSLSLRMSDETSHGFGETGDSEMLDMLSQAVGKGPIYTSAPQFDNFFYYGNGSFQSLASVALTDGRRMSTCISSTSYNEMVDGRETGAFTVEKPETLVQRSYTALDGTELTIAQNDTQAIIYAYLDKFYVVVDMSINPWRQSPGVGEDAQTLTAKQETDFSLSDDAVNFAADSINYKNIGK